jgi:mRNA-degrading endonuclease RelE of RelBE toxin-antitoxin system
MAYNISFRTSADQAFSSLDNSLRNRTEEKLEQIADCEFRKPADWGYTQFDGQAASGKFDLFNSIRVFADIDEESEEIIVHGAYTRENLYR